MLCCAKIESMFVQFDTVTYGCSSTHSEIHQRMSRERFFFFFSSASDFKLRDSSDLDRAACPETRKSITDFSIFFGSSIVSWKSKKQPTISRSSSEAEYWPLTITACELQWLSYLLIDMHQETSLSIILYCDNQSTIKIARNPMFHEPA